MKVIVYFADGTSARGMSRGVRIGNRSRLRRHRGVGRPREARGAIGVARRWGNDPGRARGPWRGSGWPGGFDLSFPAIEEPAGVDAGMDLRSRVGTAPHDPESFIDQPSHYIQGQVHRPGDLDNLDEPPADLATAKADHRSGGSFPYPISRAYRVNARSTRSAAVVRSYPASSSTHPFHSAEPLTCKASGLRLHWSGDRTGAFFLATISSRCRCLWDHYHGLLYTTIKVKIVAKKKKSRIRY